MNPILLMFVACCCFCPAICARDVLGRRHSQHTLGNKATHGTKKKSRSHNRDPQHQSNHHQHQSNHTSGDPCECPQKFPFCWLKGEWQEEEDKVLHPDQSCYSSITSFEVDKNTCFKKCTDSYNPRKKEGPQQNFAKKLLLRQLSTWFPPRETRCVKKTKKKEETDKKSKGESELTCEPERDTCALKPKKAEPDFECVMNPKAEELKEVDTDAEVDTKDSGAEVDTKDSGESKPTKHAPDMAKLWEEADAKFLERFHMKEEIVKSYASYKSVCYNENSHCCRTSPFSDCVTGLRCYTPTHESTKGADNNARNDVPFCQHVSSFHAQHLQCKHPEHPDQQVNKYDDLPVCGSVDFAPTDGCFYGESEDLNEKSCPTPPPSTTRPPNPHPKQKSSKKGGSKMKLIEKMRNVVKAAMSKTKGKMGGVVKAAISKDKGKKSSSFREKQAKIAEQTGPTDRTKFTDPGKNPFFTVKAVYYKLKQGLQKSTTNPKHHGVFFNLLNFGEKGFAGTEKFLKAKGKVWGLDDPMVPHKKAAADEPDAQKRRELQFLTETPPYFELLKRMIELVATWHTSPILQTMLEWDRILDMVWKGHLEGGVCVQNDWKERAAGIEGYTTNMMLAMLKAINEFIETTEAINKQSTDGVRTDIATLKDILTYDEPNTYGDAKYLTYLRENRAQVHMMFSDIWNQVKMLYFGTAATERREKDEIAVSNNPQAATRAFSIMEKVRANLDVIDTVEQAYFNSDAAEGNKNALRTFGTVLSIAGAITGVAGGGFGVGPALGAMAKGLTNHFAKKLDPDKDLHKFRVELRDKVSFILQGDTTTDLGTPKPPCRFGPADVDKIDPTTFSKTGDKEHKDSVLQYLVPTNEAKETLENGVKTLITSSEYLEYVTDQGSGDQDVKEFYDKYRAIRDAGLCEPLLSRLERVRYAFYFMNIIRQCHHETSVPVKDRLPAYVRLRHAKKPENRQKNCNFVCEQYGEKCDGNQPSNSAVGYQVRDFMKEMYGVGCYNKQYGSFNPESKNYVAEEELNKDISPYYKIKDKGCRWVKNGDKKNKVNCEADVEGQGADDRARICPCVGKLIHQMKSKNPNFGMNKQLMGFQWGIDAEGGDLHQKMNDLDVPVEFRFPAGIAKSLTAQDPWIKALFPYNVKDVADLLKSVAKLVRRSMEVLQHSVGSGSSKALERLNTLSDFGANIWGTPGAVVGGTQFGGFGGLIQPPEKGVGDWDTLLAALVSGLG